MSQDVACGHPQESLFPTIRVSSQGTRPHDWRWGLEGGTLGSSQRDQWGKNLLAM